MYIIQIFGLNLPRPIISHQIKRDFGFPFQQGEEEEVTEKRTGRDSDIMLKYIIPGFRSSYETQLLSKYWIRMKWSPLLRP